MIPVRRWPLYAALVLGVKSGPWMPLIRWTTAPVAVFDAVVCVLLGAWWWAVVFGLLGVAAVASSYPAQRASALLCRELLAIRDTHAAEGGDAR